MKRRSFGGRVPIAVLRLAVFLLTAVIWAIPVSVPAQTAASEGTPCMTCHKPSATTVDPAQYAQSVHGQLDCAICHGEGFSKFPHTDKRLSAPQCTTCHTGSSPYDFDGIANDVKQSVHARRVDPAFLCTNCHSPHYFLPINRLTDARQAVRIANQSCLGCHGRGATADERKAAVERLANKHQWIPHWEVHLRTAPCVACHTPSAELTLHRILPASQALRDCATCHAQNSMLVTKLYSHLALKERAEHGWINSVLFNNAYLVGATRNRWIDWGMWIVAGLTILGVAAHGAGRWFAARMRRGS